MKRIACFALLVMLFACSCGNHKDFVYKNIENFSLKQAGLNNTTLSMDVRMYNPNRRGMKLKKANVDVFLNGNSLGKLRVTDKFPVPGLDTFLLPVMLDVDIKKALPNALQLLMNSQVDIKLTGTIKAGRHGVYIRVPLNYEGKQDIRSGIKW